MKLISRVKFSLFILALAGIAICGLVYAELIGIQPQLQFPIIAYNTTGTTHYDAASDLLSVDAQATSVLISTSQPPTFVMPNSGGSKAVTIRVYVDEAGNVYDGDAGHDFILEGAIDTSFPHDGVPEYDGIL